MNFKNILLAASVIGGLLSASSLSATVIVDQAASTDLAVYTAPVPVKIVTPTGITRRYAGETIRLGLIVDATGHPKDIRFLSGRDPNLVRNLLPAVAQWQFTPAKKNGQPVSAHVELPLKLVDESAS